MDVCFFRVGRNDLAMLHLTPAKVYAAPTPVVFGLPRICHKMGPTSSKWSYGAPINGRREMENWGL